MNNFEARKWYLDKISSIPAMDAEAARTGVPLEERARRAWKIRHEARRQTRRLMSDRVAVGFARLRDRVVYGHPDGPSFEQLIAEGRREGLTVDQTLLAIIQGATSTNTLIDWIFRRRQSRGPKRRPSKK
jgi:hypothetical protein